MEFMGRPRPSEACSLLAVPGLSYSDVDEDDGDEIICIRPKSSPIPSRKSSFTDEDSEPEFPLCGSRRVSFADAKGLSLVQVKEFDMWDVPKLPGYESVVTDGNNLEKYFLSPLTFSLPLQPKELFARVHEQKIEMETIELLPGTTILKGVIRVLNISYNKSVYVRTTLDNWSNHFDLLAEYIPGSSDGVTDCFSFKLTLVPPFEEQGARVDFCLRYETPVGTFWANNNNRNYVLFCHHRMNRVQEKARRDSVNKKSCLKTLNQNVSTVENISAKQASSQENISTDESVSRLETQKISEGQTVTCRENDQRSLVESRQNSSRRRQRKAARTARVRDYFAQRDGEESDRDESLPEIKQATHEKVSGDKQVCLQPFSEGGGESEGLWFVSEALKTSSKPINNASCDQTCIEKLEISDPAVLGQGGGVTNIPKNSMHSAEEAAPEERPNTRELLTETEERSQNLDTNSFTFSTVVAPLYNQVFSKTLRERSKPETLVPLNAGSESINVQKTVTENQKSNNECLDSSKDKEINELNRVGKEKTSAQSDTNTSQGQKCPLGGRSEYLNELNAVLDPQTTSRCERRQEIAKEEDRTAADPQEQRCKQILTDQADVGSEKLEGEERREISCTETYEDRDTDKISTEISTSLNNVLDDLNINQTDKTAAKTRMNQFVSQFTSPGTSQIDSIKEGIVSQKDLKNSCDDVQVKDRNTVEKQDEKFLLEDNDEMNNWETTPECEEHRIIRNHWESKKLNAKPNDAKAAEKDTSEGNEEKTKVLNKEQIRREENDAKFSTGKEVELMFRGLKAEKIVGVKETNKETEGSDETKMQKMKYFTEMQQVSFEEKNIQEIEEIMEIHINDESKPRVVNVTEQNSDYREKMTVYTEEETEMTDSYIVTENRENEVECYKERSDVPQNKTKDSLSAPVSNELEVVKGNTQNKGNTCMQTDDDDARSKAGNILPDEPESDRTSDDGSSVESDSGDEVELYMHCLRAAGAASHKDKNKDGGFTVSRASSSIRGKLPPTLMPSINESIDEDLQAGGPQEDPKHVQTAATGSEQKNIRHNFSCCSVSKAFLYTTLLVVFVVVAYHYDFLACFGLYMISVIWLCWQGKTQPKQEDNRAR